MTLILLYLFRYKNEIYNIGVFEEIGDAMPKILYLFIPYKSINDYYQAIENLKRDKDLQLADYVFNLAKNG